VEALVVKKLLVERAQWERERERQQEEEFARLERTLVKRLDDESQKLRDGLNASLSSSAAAAASAAAGNVQKGLSREEVEDIVRRKVADARYDALQEALKREEETKRALEERWRKDLFLKEEEWRRRQEEWERRTEDERRRWQEMGSTLLYQQQQQKQQPQPSAAPLGGVPKSSPGD